jgi:hypothetical protein
MTKNRKETTAERHPAREALRLHLDEVRAAEAAMGSYQGKMTRLQEAIRAEAEAQAEVGAAEARNAELMRQWVEGDDATPPVLDRAPVETADKLARASVLAVAARAAIAKLTQEQNLAAQQVHALRTRTGAFVAEVMLVEAQRLAAERQQLRTRYSGMTMALMDLRVFFQQHSFDGNENGQFAAAVAFPEEHFTPSHLPHWSGFAAALSADPDAELQEKAVHLPFQEKDEVAA